jgi:hypothetical protein
MYAPPGVADINSDVGATRVKANLALLAEIYKS